ncbi:probable disease resistance protein At4g27220 isoform X2 [Malus sylvestris]|uniref:probable disease resistance protein At4g27220 isoform X2 n=1 Tax=Malus sylvestris TaxID=3752 RepID=UPI0021ABF640|nr:probable disease resistance protein At4g27220 isoform X2 [Malus sylvestris]
MEPEASELPKGFVLEQPVCIGAPRNVYIEEQLITSSINNRAKGMEIVIQIVGKVAEYAVEPAIRQVGYLAHCKRNLESLQTKVSELSAARERLEREVVREEDKGDFQNWLKRVVEITEKANELWKPDTQAKMSCLRGVCPNPVLRYKLGRRSTKLEQAVVELYAKRDFAVIPQEVCMVSHKPYEAFDSRTSTVEKIMDELRIPNNDLILVYGNGGVGKTTLVEEVLKQAVNEKLFADAVMVRSVQKPDLEGIQKEIAKKLGMEVRDSDTMSERAPHLCHRVKDKKVLVILDNILESIDLQSVGLPCLPTCRILLTSRTRKLLSSERSLKDFELRVLNEEEAWRLFQTKAGDVVKNPDIRTVATDVAKKCGGLPLLVVTVASSLRNRSNLPVWKDALRSLKLFDNEDQKKAYSVLEWSYSQLDGRKLKPLFLICGILVNHFGKAYLTDLLKYTIGLGLFKNSDSVEHAQNALHSWIEELKDSCLLLDSEDNTSIAMHDLLRDVAISIASKGHRALLRAKGDDLKEWPNIKEFSEKCKMISLSCKNIPRLPEVLKCQQLELFLLRGKGDLLEIPANFFVETKKLKVMDLTKARISSLPPSLHLLQNLQTLCLDSCMLGDVALVGQLSQLEILSFVDSKFKELPEEIGKLTRLRLLDLSGCSELEVISPNVISRLTSLEDLRMKKSFNRWVPEGVTGERSNASLSELKDLPRLAALSIHVPDAGSIPTDLFTDKLKRYQILIGPGWEWNGVDETLNTLKLKLPTGYKLDHGLEMLLKRSCEDLYLDGLWGAHNVVHHSGSEDFQQLKHLHVQKNAQFTHIITEEVVLPKLTSLVVDGCDRLTFVLSSSMARNLVQLQKLEIIKCESMEEIVSTKEYGEEKTDGMFCKLQHLKLKYLPKLSRFCSVSCNVQFLSLESLELEGCKELKGFVFDPKLETEEVYFLFDDKVGFPKLEKLSIRELSIWTTVWHNKLDPDSFYKLRDVDVHRCGRLISIITPSIAGRLNALRSLSISGCDRLEVVFEIKETPDTSTTQLKMSGCENLDSVSINECEKLKYIFPCSVARGLQQLRVLRVKDCDGMEEIVSKEEGLEMMPKFVFPKATNIVFINLAQLKSFYPGIHASEWPLLERVEVRKCGKLDIFASKISSFQKHELGGLDTPIKHSLFLIDKDVSFPNLEKMTLDGDRVIRCGPSTSQFFRKLKSLTFKWGQKVSLFENNVNPDASFPHITVLKLYEMWKLMYLRNENFPGAGPVFPNLEVLRVVGCPELKHIGSWSSAIPFQNLTTLEVHGCRSLKYLATYTIAKTLKRLREMSVGDCKRMTEIGATTSDGDDAGNDGEISFCQLQSLELYRLPSLQDFFSGNCIVKFPSLKTVNIYKCPKLKINRSKWKSSPELQGVQLTEKPPKKPSQFVRELKILLHGFPC